MTALSGNIVNPVQDREFFSDDAAASVHVYVGALVALDSSGNARPGRADVTDRIRGIADKECDNSSGAAGALQVKSRARVGHFVNSAGGDEITKADFGAACYVVDDATVAKTSNSGTRPPAGVILGLSADSKVIVFVGDTKSLNGDLVSTNDLSDVDDVPTARGNLGITGWLTIDGIPLDADGTYYIPAPPKGCTVTEVRTVVEGATTTTGAPDVDVGIDGTPMTDGSLAIAIGTVVGEQDSASPSALNVLVDGDNITIDVTANAQDASATMSVTLEFTY